MKPAAHVKTPAQYVASLPADRAKSPDDLPLEAIGQLIGAISSEEWIEIYEQSRLKTKAGQAQQKRQIRAPRSKPASATRNMREKRAASRRRR